VPPATSPLDGKTTTRRVRLPVLFGAVTAVIAVVIVWLGQLHNDRIAWVRHTLEVETAISELNNTLNQAEAVQRGYLLTGQLNFLRVYDRARTNIPAEIGRLQTLTFDNPDERAAIPALRAAVQHKFQELDGAAALRRVGELDAATASMRDGTTRTLTADILRISGRMRQTEEALLAARTRDAEILDTALLITVGLSGLVVLVFAGLWVEQARKAGGELETAYQELSVANGDLVAEMASRAAAEGQVRQMQKMEAIGQLTGGIAHDFNNMLAVIIGNLNMTQRRLAKGQTDVGAFADSAMEAANRAATLTSRLLAFSRQQPLAPEPLEPNRLVLGMSDLMARTLGEEVVVETVLGAGLWRTEADAAQLESALVNLAVNARDAMGGGGRLTVETANTYLDSDYADAAGARPGQYVMIAVTDTGEGMSQAVIEKAVEPFFTTKPVGKGTGLGLSQVYGFVKQSGGHLKIYSELGLGTTVKIYLPRLFGADAAPEAPRAARPPGGEANRTVLVAEDDERVRLFAVEALRDLGYRVVEADSAMRALARLKAEPDVALLLTDIIMPETNGRQLAEQARELRPDLPVIYMTGFTRNAVVHNGILDPGLNFLPKPFTVDQLAAKVREALDGARV
jgi:signal transduction histidine kinase